MALKKKEALQNGFTAEYWRVARVEINYDARFVNCVLAGYKNEAVRRDTNAKIITREVNMRDDEFDTFFKTDESLPAQCYAAARAKDPLFKDAVNA